jgi:short subunit dehydrogenase-like uncharacterized protein
MGSGAAAACAGSGAGALRAWAVAQPLRARAVAQPLRVCRIAGDRPRAYDPCMAPATALIYGANGYSGRLIARLAREHGVTPVLAGRDAAGVGALAGELGLDHRVFALSAGGAVERGLDGMAVVLHCAGPFAHTYEAMSDACLRTGVHYLDITGEIDVFEGLAARDGAARRAGVMLLPGVGFDVVPSDCLAVHLARRLPSATRLLLGIRGSGGLSRGTAATAVENQARGGVVRRGGQLVRVPAAWRTRRIDFGRGPRTAVAIPWGDVATAYRSTGIGDIEVYAALPVALRALIRASRHGGRLLRAKWVRAVQKRLIRARRPGPSDDELAHGTSTVWGRVEDDAGRSATGLVHGPNAYLLTAHAAAIVMRRVLAGDIRPGFQTPATAYGPNLVLEVPATTRTDVP